MKKSYLLAVVLIALISIGGYALAQQGGTTGPGAMGPGYYGMMGGFGTPSGRGFGGMMGYFGPDDADEFGQAMFGGFDWQQMAAWCHGWQAPEEPQQQGTGSQTKTK